ncbi:MAG: hypothetical protein A2986_00850 [Candidatus Jacksonbacteria bacterium RIFCSPLOWO2_01_FULL_44_13]|uniref:VCBS repeat-containing protein n=1 Tax=candidate division CPR1 bacterium GW2011_GWA2_42_17 TaxID=1618341 RepID=A0A0G1C3U6_9BACT|nr:MAG: hypothetical protein UV05_C0007G0018 [candidate division CPR1 bacterium GW2011_GWA2_42_17]OGY71011.1 MAG: hypothetical protein A2986_00850 [Candidatus Jacksonbacteria bacterium RIFCSPLOWO2_01_FULL_44_13]
MKLRKYLLFGGVCCIFVAIFIVAGVVIVRSINTPQAPWRLDTSWKAPVDMRWGAVFAELNGDGLPDILKSYRHFDPPTIRGAYINTGAGWQEDNRWLPPDDISFGNDSIISPYGVVAVDLNGDGLSDLVRSERDEGGVIRSVYLNTGAGWKNTTDEWVKGWDSGAILERRVDGGLRFQDLNGDGLVDMIRTYTQPYDGQLNTWVYLNQGTGVE